MMRNVFFIIFFLNNEMFFFFIYTILMVYMFKVGQSTTVQHDELVYLYVHEKKTSLLHRSNNSP